MRSDAYDYYRAKLAKLPDASIRMFERPGTEVERVKHVHIVGVCGTAMASLAGLLVEAGYEVSGSDASFYPPMSTLIERLGIEFSEGYAAEQVERSDLVIIGNAIHVDNPEAAFAREQGIPQISVAEALQNILMRDKSSLVVAGTHGKTTTAGLLSHVFTSAGQEPSFLVGGATQGVERNFRLGKGAHFIIEGDEYDTAYFDKAPKFLHYRPFNAIVTSVEFDHADIFRDVEDYRQAFRYFVCELPPEGSLFIYGDDPVIENIASLSEAQVIRYGLGEGNDISAKEISVSSEGQSFLLTRNDENIGKLFVPLPGEHNLLNTLATCGMSLLEGVSFKELKAALKSFPGMKRRQEVRGEVSGVTVIDDFAHHPTAVRETTRAIRSKYPSRRLVAVFQPRSNTSRRKIFEEDYGAAFVEADLAFIASSPFLRSDSQENMIDGERVASLIRQRGTEAHFGGSVERLLTTLKATLMPGDVVLIMSNGDFGGIHQRLLDVLEPQGST